MQVDSALSSILRPARATPSSRKSESGTAAVDGDAARHERAARRAARCPSPRPTATRPMRAPALRASSRRVRWNASAEASPATSLPLTMAAALSPGPRRRAGRPSSPTLKRISSRQLIFRTVSSVLLQLVRRDQRASLLLAPLHARRAPPDEALPRGGRRLVGHEQERPRLRRGRIVELPEGRRAVGRRALGRVGQDVDPVSIREVVVLAAGAVGRLLHARPGRPGGRGAPVP